VTGSGATPRLAVAVTLAALALGSCAYLARSSVGPPPGNAQAVAASRAPSISAHGRWVAFESAADNLVPNDTNGVSDVFVHDNVSGVTERVSVDANGGQLGAASSDPSISDDGRRVAFTTAAPIDPTDTQGTNDVYVKDRQTGAVARASDGRMNGCDRPVLSSDGMSVAFECYFEYVIPNAGSVKLPLGPLVHHFDTDQTVEGLRASTPYSYVVDYALSSDGGVVISTGTSVQAPEGSVTIADARAGTILQSLPGVTGTYIGPVTMSGDARWFAFAARTNEADTGVLRFARTATPQQSVLTEVGPLVAGLSMSADGAWIGAQVTIDGTPVAARRSTNGTDPWTIVSRIPDDTRIFPAGDAAMSTDGAWFAFTATDPDLVADDTNGVADVFTRSVARNSPVPNPT
jgi:hypothetical protein